MTISWCCIPSADKNKILSEIEQEYQNKLKSGAIKEDELRSVLEMERVLLSKSAQLSPSELENLRKLCQLWDIRLNPHQITSHRPIIGKVIVLIKKLIYPILNLLLKDLIRQQREFNAASLKMIARLLEK